MIDDVGRKRRWKQSNTGDCNEDGAGAKLGKVQKQEVNFKQETEKVTFKVQQEKNRHES